MSMFVSFFRRYVHITYHTFIPSPFVAVILLKLKGCQIFHGLFLLKLRHSIVIIKACFTQADLPCDYFDRVRKQRGSLGPFARCPRFVPSWKDTFSQPSWLTLSIKTTLRHVSSKNIKKENKPVNVHHTSAVIVIISWGRYLWNEGEGLASRT